MREVLLSGYLYPYPNQPMMRWMIPVRIRAATDLWRGGTCRGPFFSPLLCYTIGLFLCERNSSYCRN